MLILLARQGKIVRFLLAGNSTGFEDIFSKEKRHKPNVYSVSSVPERSRTSADMP
jgi:hypothetical protein